MQKLKKIAASLFCMAAITAAVGITASAEPLLLGYRGDVNQDSIITTADAVIMQKFLTGAMEFESDSMYVNADVNDDQVINIYDLIFLKRCITGQMDWIGIYGEDPDATETTEPSETETDPLITTISYLTYPEESTTSETETTTSVVTTGSIELPFIPAPIAEIDSSLPSQGDANLVIFYVDFPDCTYGSADMTADQVEGIAFGAEDLSDVNYPFESMSAFYKRSSKGAMNLTGKVFRYTTKENRSSYDTDKVKLAKECYEAFNAENDFSSYDADMDGYIDATLFTVPTAAGDTDWWPCAGAFGDASYVVDGVKIGHIITGNAQIESVADYSNFNSSYLHEMGHCMGFPDYYLYSSDDYDGMHGSAGYELMDADAFSDFCSFSKLMLGWYRENQISVYDKSKGSQTFELINAQTEDGNCVIIPMDDLGGNYASGEYFIIEYSTNAGNNNLSSSRPWQVTSDGIRIYHVKPEIYDNGWWKSFKYSNGSEFTDTDGDGTPDDQGIRLIRLVNDGNDAFTSGAVISYGTPGFGWYNSSEEEAVDPGVTIKVGEHEDGKYTITIE